MKKLIIFEREKNTIKNVKKIFFHEFDIQLALTPRTNKSVQ